MLAASLLFRFTAALVALSALLAAAPAFAAYTINGGPGPSPVNPTTPNADYAQLDSIMTQFMLNANVPNAQLAVGYEGKIIFNRAYTASTAERALQTGITTAPASANTYNEPAYTITQPNTRFRLASLSKFVTGLAIEQLVLDGKVSLTESAYEILREGTVTTPFDGAPADARMLNTTVQHLITHEAGFDRDCVIYPTPLNCQPAGQPADITAYPDPMSFVKPWPYPYNSTTPDPNTEWVKSCKRHLELDLPRRLLHYTPGAPPLQGGEYYQYYTNLAFCWATRVIEIKSGMTYENYVLQKVLRPLGIDKAGLVTPDMRDRLWQGDTANAEIASYYDQPLSVDPNAHLVYIWCAVYAHSPYTPCVEPRMLDRSLYDAQGAGGWVFSAQEYLRMLQSAKGRNRAPHLLDFPGSNVTGSDALYTQGPQVAPAVPANSYVAGRYMMGAYVDEYSGTVPGINVSHSGSYPGVRSTFQFNRRGWSFVITLNTNPEWGLSGNERSCASTTTTRVKYWCLLRGVATSGFTLGITNSLPNQLTAMYNDAGKRTVMQNATDLWVPQVALPCNLDVNGTGNGVRNGVADGLMILRAMQGKRGAAIAGAASGTTSAATTTYDRAEKNARDLVSTKVVDIDGDGTVNPAIDGVILLRAMLGLKGTAITAGLTIPGVRSDPNAIRTYLNTSCAAALP
jgi:CubicO group peptidase (beta-lactamase class C family)